MSEGWERWEREIREEPPLLIVPGADMIDEDGGPPWWALLIFGMVCAGLVAYDVFLIATR